MSLFGGLPPTSAHLRTKDSDAEDEEEEELEELEGLNDGEDDEEWQPEQEEPVEQNLELRRRPRQVELDQDAQADDKPVKRPCHPMEVAIALGPAPSAVAAAQSDVTLALLRITSHISNPSKFAKASPLLRKLLDGDLLDRQAHGPTLFAAVRTAFADPTTCVEPLLQREYMKLVGACASRPDLLGKLERAHLDVYRILGQVQNEMHTDDNFVFSKALAHVREVADSLTDVEPEDDAVYSRLLAALEHASGAEVGGSGRSSAPWAAPGSAHADEEQRRQQHHAQQLARHEQLVVRHAQQLRQHQLHHAVAEAAAAKLAASAPADVEADPFGLDNLLGAPLLQTSTLIPDVPPPPPPPPTLPASQPSTSAWSAHEVACMRRAAVLECLHTSRGFHRLAWARTGVELLIERCHEQRQRFLAAQQPQLDDLMGWVRHERALRKKVRVAWKVSDVMCVVIFVVHCRPCVRSC